ncbi:hypothetical protein MXB_3811, partial [Myxobolus squamalis]
CLKNEIDLEKSATSKELSEMSLNIFNCISSLKQKLSELEGLVENRNVLEKHMSDIDKKSNNFINDIFNQLEKNTLCELPLVVQSQPNNTEPSPKEACDTKIKSMLQNQPQLPAELLPSHSSLDRSPAVMSLHSILEQIFANLIHVAKGANLICYEQFIGNQHMPCVSISCFPPDSTLKLIRKISSYDQTPILSVLIVDRQTFFGTSKGNLCHNAIDNDGTLIKKMIFINGMIYCSVIQGRKVRFSVYLLDQLICGYANGDLQCVPIFDNGWKTSQWIGDNVLFLFNHESIPNIRILNANGAPVTTAVVRLLEINDIWKRICNNLV